MFFYYFSIILIIGAQINAHFFDKYPPLDTGLGTYLSQMYEEHHHDNIEQSSNDSPKHTSGCINKLWPFNKRYSVQPLSDENNNV